jgi:hypothetical protein
LTPPGVAPPGLVTILVMSLSSLNSSGGSTARLPASRIVRAIAFRPLIVASAFIAGDRP